MDVFFELSDRYHEELGPWPARVGASCRVQLYAYRDHSPAQHGGRLLLPDLALAPPGTPLRLARAGLTTSAFTAMVGELRARRAAGPERRDEAIMRLECGVPVCMMLTVRRWDNVDVAPAVPPEGVEAWRMARNPRVADLLSGLIELQEVAFEAGGVSSFPLLDERAPDYPISGIIGTIERLNLNPSAAAFGAMETVESLPETLYWPHRYFLTVTPSGS